MRIFHFHSENPTFILSFFLSELHEVSQFYQISVIESEYPAL